VSAAPDTDRDASTTDRLANRGLTHRPSKTPGRRDIIDAAGAVVLSGVSAFEVNVWLNAGMPARPEWTRVGDDLVCTAGRS
jgi:hypothetical protein